MVGTKEEGLGPLLGDSQSPLWDGGWDEKGGKHIQKRSTELVQLKKKEERLLIKPHLRIRTCQINETLCHG
jgi:hypothetical protein